jgi:hypothetical protein
MLRKQVKNAKLHCEAMLIGLHSQYIQGCIVLGSMSTIPVYGYVKFLASLLNNSSEFCKYYHSHSQAPKLLCYAEISQRFLPITLPFLSHAQPTSDNIPIKNSMTCACFANICVNKQAFDPSQTYIHEIVSLHNFYSNIRGEAQVLTFEGRNCPI